MGVSVFPIALIAARSALNSWICCSYFLAIELLTVMRSKSTNGNTAYAVHQCFFGRFFYELHHVTDDGIRFQNRLVLAPGFLV
jgi:hypothetical protein